MVKNARQKWFLTSANPRKSGTGSDFYLDLMVFMKRNSFKTINTLTYGHLLLFVYETLLFLRIPKGALIVTTHVGFPRQLLALNGLSNRIRFYLFRKFKNYKRWQLYILPIDLPLEQFKYRLAPNMIRVQQRIESKYFACADGFISCGDVLTEYFLQKYPKSIVLKIDMYDQLISNSVPIKISKEKNQITRVAIAGNLSRMIDKVNLLPRSKGIEYCFFGPNGEALVNSSREDFVLFGKLEENEFISELRNCNYGLILYSAAHEDYFKNVIAGKFTSYLLAELIILCPKLYTSMSIATNKLNVGFVLNTLQDIPSVVQNAGSTSSIKQSLAEQSRKIRVGDHYKKALDEIK